MGILDFFPVFPGISVILGIHHEGAQPSRDFGEFWNFLRLNDPKIPGKTQIIRGNLLWDQQKIPGKTQNPWGNLLWDQQKILEYLGSQPWAKIPKYSIQMLIPESKKSPNIQFKSSFLWGKNSQKSDLFLHF